ncbi:lysophospholipase, partial [Escherichia coli]|nr:lysophospholipase [Escherichia coli]
MDDAALDEYWKAYEGWDRRRAHLELYRSGDFEKIAAYDMGVLDVPALILWGADDPFAPVAGAHRFARELRQPRLEVLEG